tara:strand:+ start:1328 stop:1513 length:186 start_codon:yes stop_codon:yes gene_type:complete
MERKRKSNDEVYIKVPWSLERISQERFENALSDYIDRISKLDIKGGKENANRIPIKESSFR